MLAELVVGQERMTITPNVAFKWAWSMLISLTIPCVFNVISNIYFWKTNVVSSSIQEIENVYNSSIGNLYYIVIGILFCAIRYRKTITLKPNIGKRTSKYIIMLVFNMLILALFCLVCEVYIYDKVISYIQHIARVRRYTYEHLFFLYALFPAMGAFDLRKTYIAYQATRFLFDKDIRAN